MARLVNSLRINQKTVQVRKSTPHLYFNVQDPEDDFTQSGPIRFRIEQAFNKWKDSYLASTYAYINDELVLDNMQFDWSNKRGILAGVNTYLTYVGQADIYTYNQASAVATWL